MPGRLAAVDLPVVRVTRARSMRRCQATTARLVGQPGVASPSRMPTLPSSAWMRASQSSAGWAASARPWAMQGQRGERRRLGRRRSAGA